MRKLGLYGGVGVKRDRNSRSVKDSARIPQAFRTEENGIFYLSRLRGKGRMGVKMVSG